MANKPTHTAFTVRDYKTSDGKDKGRWLEIGAAWVHKDGKGFDLLLDAVPVGGRLVIRTIEDKAE